MPTVAQLRATYKEADAWWTVLLVDPVAVRLLRLVLPLRWVTPNLVTIAAFVIGLGSAACFYRGSTTWLVAGAVLYHVAFIFDCVDGKLARWREAGSSFGAWLDMAMDRLRVLACTAGLMGGQYVQTGQVGYLYLGLGIVFLDVFRQWNGLQIFTMRRELGLRVAQVRGSEGAAAAHPAGKPRDDTAAPAAFLRLRDWLLRHRIRPHLISGIEFQMAVFIVAPLTGLIVLIPAALGALFVIFEVLIVGKFWLTARRYEATLAAARPNSPIMTLAPRNPADHGSTTMIAAEQRGLADREG